MILEIRLIKNLQNFFTSITPSPPPYPWQFHNVSISNFTLLVCLSVGQFVSDKLQNGGIDRAQILCGTLHNPTKVYGWSKFQKLASNKFRFLLNFKIPRNCFYKIRELLFVIVLQCKQRENVHNWNRIDGRKDPESLV